MVTEPRLCQLKFTTDGKFRQYDECGRTDIIQPAKAISEIKKSLRRLHNVLCATPYCRFLSMGDMYLESASASLGGVWLDSDGNPHSIVETAQRSTGKWYQVTFTHNDVSKTTSLYIDGKLVGTPVTGIDSENGSQGCQAKIALGSLCVNTITFSGILDEIYVYPQALSEAEIQTLYAEQVRNRTVARTTDSSTADLYSGQRPEETGHRQAANLLQSHHGVFGI